VAELTNGDYVAATHPTVLVVDDEPDIRELLAITLDRMGVSPTTVDTVDAAKSGLLDHHYDLCLTDMRLPDGDGLELVAWMQDHAPDVPVAVITAHGNVELAVRALKLGAFDFVSKPLDLADLRKLVSSALKLKADLEDTIVLQGKRLLGDSAAIKKVRELVAKVARSQAPVHICGESGTGKELVAHLIHDSGPRADRPFVPVNCGAIPTELMESEFFGHRKGSFTGAVADKEGLMQSAEGGTLFLDEIADLPLHMQVKLLRVIQERSVRPIGGTGEIPVDIRILSATHKNLEQEVAEGRFREDLYYRINVIELPVPPLRERGGDVLVLARHLLKRQARAMQLPVPELSPEAEQNLLAYHFPGNVRELENVLERAITLASNERIEAGDIQLRAGPPPSAPVASHAGTGGALGEQLEDIEREAIVQALEQTRYNKTKAAQLLGISFRALRYRIKKFEIE
jgi:two-component system response regulator PilR (NtrC family)